MQAAVSRLFVHRVEGVEQRRQSALFHEAQNKRMRLRPQRRLQTVHQFGPRCHFVVIVLGERQLKPKNVNVSPGTEESEKKVVTSAMLFTLAM